MIRRVDWAAVVPVVGLVVVAVAMLAIAWWPT